MNISEIFLFCSTMSPACKPCFSFIKDSPLLVQEIQIIRLDTKNIREKVKRGVKFQIRVVPTLMVIYNDGDTSLYQGQKKVLTWLFMRMKTFEQDQQDQYFPPHHEEVHRTPREKDVGLYSTNPPQSLTPPESEIEFFPNNAQPKSQPAPSQEEQPSSSNLDINARRQDKDGRMGDLVTVARKMEESRQSHLTTNETPSGNLAPSPIKQF